MDKELRAALDLPEDAKETEVLEAVKLVRAKAEKAEAMTAQHTAADAEKTDLEKQIASLNAKLVEMSQAQAREKAESFVAQAIERFQIVQQLAQNAARFPDSLVFPLFKDGDKERCYDGQYFFDEDHPGFDGAGNETSVSNVTKGSDPAWYLIDDTQVIKPMVFQNRRDFTLIAKDNEADENVFVKNQFLYGVSGRANAGFGLWQLAHKASVALTPENYASARQKMMTIRKRDGQVIDIRPTKLLVPPSLEGQALQLATAETINGTSNIWRGSTQPVVIPLLG